MEIEADGINGEEEVDAFDRRQREGKRTVEENAIETRRNGTLCEIYTPQLKFL